MKTRVKVVSKLCSQGHSYSEAMEMFYAYWEKKINEVKREREVPFFVGK